MDIRNQLPSFTRSHSISDRSQQAQPADNSALKAEAGQYRQSVLPQGSAQLEDPKEAAAKLAAQINVMNRELMEAMTEYGKISDRAERSFIDSYKGFEQFKENILAEQPDLNLDDLDVRLEDGELHLSSETLSDKQLQDLEKKLTEDEELTDTLTGMLTDMTRLSHYHPNQEGRTDFNVDPDEKIENSTMSLNELVDAYNKSFERFHDNSYTVRSDKALSGADEFELVLDHYQTFESRYERDGLSRFAWFDLVNNSTDNNSGPAISTRV